MLAVKHWTSMEIHLAGNDQSTPNCTAAIQPILWGDLLQLVTQPEKKCGSRGAMGWLMLIDWSRGGHKLWSSQIKSYLKLLNSSWDPASIKPLPLARQSACGCLTSAQGFLCCGMWEAVKKQHLWISKEKNCNRLYQSTYRTQNPKFTPNPVSSWKKYLS